MNQKLLIEVKMPIEVISTEPTKWLEVTCPKCYYRLRYTPLDIGKDYEEDPILTCPRSECRHTFYIKREY